MVNRAADSVLYGLAGGSCVNEPDRPLGVASSNRSCVVFSHCWFDSLGKRVDQPTPSGVLGSPTPAGCVASGSVVEAVVAPVPFGLETGVTFWSVFTPLAP